MEVTCCSGTSVDFKRTTGCSVPEDRTDHKHRCEKLKSHTVTTLFRMLYITIRSINISNTRKYVIHAPLPGLISQRCDIKFAMQAYPPSRSARGDCIYSCNVEYYLFVSSFEYGVHRNTYTSII
jgi:hypothetical protein